jgi:predicted nucleic acid-binding protein
MAFVVDVSVAMGWLLHSQATSLTIAAEDAVAHDVGWVPSHFGIEIARALRLHERRRLITPETVDDALLRLRELPLKEDATQTLDLMVSIVALARRYNLRIADAAYLELAIRLGLPLATRDASLARAAREAGVALFTASSPSHPE